MRKAVAGFWWSPASEGVSALVMTAAFFAFGSVAGSLFSSHIGNGEGAVVSLYLEQFLSTAQKDGLLGPDVIQFLWLSLRWPLVAIAFGFSSLGLFGIPILSAMRGFLFSFSVGTFAHMLGYRGIGVAFLLLGISGCISVPVFLLIATQSFSAAKTLASKGQGKRETPYSKLYVLRCCLSLCLLCLGLIVEWHILPTLFSGWANALLS